MARIEFPERLRSLLEESELHAPLRGLADRVGEILTDNKLTFFPDYTDHGIDHVNRVLQAEEELIPVEVWDRLSQPTGPRALCDVDAAVIIGATLLHDIAMHVTPIGFQKLIGGTGRFQPLPWFKEDQEGHPADRQWEVLWNDYVREARRFNDATLANIVGYDSVRNGWKFQTLPDHPGQWERNHYLIAGEFLRRHHARLAHEIALFGFPGIPVGAGEGEFPSLGRDRGNPLFRLADLIGLAARSHGMSMRVCKAYLDSSPLYPGTPRPMGAAVLYAMALLRVADYLQIDRQRAPAVLLQLRAPQSAASIREWKKHHAVQSISPATDPRGKMVTISTDISLELYLQLQKLISALQAEMDHSSAVLDEAYGARGDLGLDQLKLATRRIYSNIHSPIFRESLPYVPEETRFSADPSLLALLVEPLYGKAPSVGVRELIQNSVDSVRELHSWCGSHGIEPNSLHLAEQLCDVLVEFVQRADGSWCLRVIDKGIGMTSSTIQNYFLRAGASFRQSPEWTKEFMEESGRVRVPRAGRFGVGIFATFLLGTEFRLSTRHASAPSSIGFTVQGSADSNLLEIRRQDGLHVGTTIEVEITSESVKLLQLDGGRRALLRLERLTDWYSWKWPSVSRQVRGDEQSRYLKPQYSLPLPMLPPPAPWSVITPSGFDAVFWTFAEAPRLTCNGIVIARPEDLAEYRGDAYVPFAWRHSTQIEPPNIAVLDSEANLPLTTQRYELSRPVLPFIGELEHDVILSLIAHALVCGPQSPADTVQTGHTRQNRHKTTEPSFRHPLAVMPLSGYRDPVHPYEQLTHEGRLRWCTTEDHFVFADPWLYRLLGRNTCLVYGSIQPAGLSWHHTIFSEFHTDDPSHARLRWDAVLTHADYSKDLEGLASLAGNLSKEVARFGILAIGHDPVGARAVISLPLWMGQNSRLLNRLRETLLPFVCRTYDSALFRSLEFRSGESFPSFGARGWQPGVDASDPEAAGGAGSGYDIGYAVELHTRPSGGNAQSLLARVWNECLGPVAIPFDKASRQQLVATARTHPGLRHHIDLWENWVPSATG